MELRVDGVTVVVPEGTTLLEACDKVGRYVPRLCSYPGLGCCLRADVEERGCRLCAVRLHDGSVVLACTTMALAGLEVTTQDAGLAAARLERLRRILVRHPHVCLACPDRDGCTRDQCTYGYPLDARCCDEFGRCELGKLTAYLDPDGIVAPGAVTVSREAVTEGRIRREPGLCVACGRCVAVCDTLPQAGKALTMTLGSEGFLARPKEDTLRASGCTFCGQCVMVCPAGALTAPGEAGARWLADRRARSDLARRMLPPEAWHEVGPESLSTVPSVAGVFRLIDADGKVLRITGTVDLRDGLTRALGEPACSAAAGFALEIEPLFTQRESELLARYAQEHGHLPPGNDLPTELFDEDL